MERGIRRQAIYEEEGDYQVFMVIVKQCLEKYGCVLHAYCMMTNHFHMLLETSDTDVSKFMKQIANCYAVYFNRKYNYQGHLFEGRYKACLVKDDAYFLQTSAQWCQVPLNFYKQTNTYLQIVNVVVE